MMHKLKLATPIVVALQQLKGVLKCTQTTTDALPHSASMMNSCAV